MRKYYFRIFVLFFVFNILGMLLFAASSVLAQNSASFSVKAVIPSNVSPELSTVKLNTDQTLADPVNHPILLTATLLDKNSTPLSGKIVKVTSDRGVADIIEATSKISSFRAHAADMLEMQTDKTDDNGIASFRISSFIPGEANFTVIADNVVKLPVQKITFRPRPIPSYLSLSVTSSLLHREFTIIPDKIQEQDLSPLQSQMAKSANFSLKVKIPDWLFLIILIMLVGFIYFIIYTINKFRRLDRKDVELTKKMSGNRAPNPQANQ